MKTVLLSIAALVMTLFFVSASYAAKVSFMVTWTPPTQDINGNSATPDGYRLYVCDKPIADLFDPKTPGAGPMASCAGALSTYEISHAVFVSAGKLLEGEYATVLETGRLYFRVSAFVNGTLGGKPSVVESGLSNEITETFTGVVIFGPITTLQRTGGGVVIIQP